MKLSFTGLNVALVLLLVPSLALGLDPSIDGTTGCFRRLNQTTGNDRQCNASLLEYLGENTTNNMSGKWGVEFPYGDVTGLSVCSTLESTSNTVATASEESILNNEYDNLTSTGVLETGQIKCWCKMTGPLSGRWVYKYSSGQSSCQSECPFYCENGVRTDAVFREALFSAVPPSVVTTQTYVDNALAGKQARITTTGTNKLMTFGSSAGNIGTKDIVGTLGTSTTATTVPEVGPIVAGINSKQNAVNGTANYVMTGTGTAGTLGEKPVYSPTTNYTNALVTAQTINTAAMNAANSELTCIDNDCLLWQINTNGPTGISTRIYLDPSIAGTDLCFRRMSCGSPSTDYNNTCGIETLSYLGAQCGYSGKWGAVFPYGDVMGKSVCVSFGGGSGYRVATADEESRLNDEYAAKAGVEQTATGGQCWCKMEVPAVSPWMWFGGQSKCDTNCPTLCAKIRNNIDWRTAVFNSIQ